MKQNQIKIIETNCLAVKYGSKCHEMIERWMQHKKEKSGKSHAIIEI